MVWEWIRQLPHPQYGNYCGINRSFDKGSKIIDLSGVKQPLDRQDEWCMVHDVLFRCLERMEDDNFIHKDVHMEARKLGDKLLGQGWKSAAMGYKNNKSRRWGRLARLLFRG